MSSSPPRIFILQNSPVGTSQPLSIYLTNLLRSLNPSGEFSLNAVTGPALGDGLIPGTAVESSYHLPGSLYRVTDNLRFTLKAFRILASEHRKAPITLLHCLYPNSSLLAAVLFRRLVAPAVRILYDVRSPWIEMIFAMQHLDRGWYRPIRFILSLQERALLRSADHLLFVTRGLADYYALHYAVPRHLPVSVLGSAVDTTIFRPSPSPLRADLALPADAVIIGYTGTLAAARQLDTFLKWFAEAAPESSEWHIVFIGEGEQRADLEALCRSLRVAERAHFLGAHEHSEMPALISGFDYGLCHYPSHPVYDHNHPLKILEYLACGVPVLATDTPAHRELSRDVPGIALYASAKDLANRLRESRPQVEPGRLPFTWSRSSQFYRRLYRDILATV